MDFVIYIAEGFIGLFQECGKQFANNITGNIPMLVTLLTMIHFITKLVGEDKINGLSRTLGRNSFLAYGILPSVAWFFFSSPGALTVGKFLPEKCKPGFEDALGRSVHPLSSLFPHIVPAELWIWLGVAGGITTLGLSTATLAVRYIMVGVIMGLVGGIITEKIFIILAKKDGKHIE